MGLLTAVAAGTTGFAIVAVALYHLLSRRDLLKNDVRREVFEFIRDHPGASVTAIAAHVGVRHQTVCYHLHLLERAHLIASHSMGPTRRYFQSGSALSSTDKQLAAIARDENAMKVLDVIAAKGSVIKKDVAVAIGATRTAAAWHIAKLVRCGLVTETRVHSLCVLRIDPQVQARLDSIAAKGSAEASRGASRLHGDAVAGGQ